MTKRTSFYWLLIPSWWLNEYQKNHNTNVRFKELCSLYWYWGFFVLMIRKMLKIIGSLLWQSVWADNGFWRIGLLVSGWISPVAPALKILRALIYCRRYQPFMPVSFVYQVQQTSRPEEQNRYKSNHPYSRPLSFGGNGSRTETGLLWQFVDDCTIWRTLWPIGGWYRVIPIPFIPPSGMDYWKNDATNCCHPVCFTLYPIGISGRRGRSSNGHLGHDRRTSLTSWSSRRKHELLLLQSV